MSDDSTASKLVPVLRSAAIEAATLTLTHPISYVKTLIQLGHEPLAPYEGRQWAFWKTAMYRPGALGYALHIKDNDGAYGLFRGLTPRLASTFMYNYTRKFMDDVVANCEQLKSEEASPSDSWDDGMKKVGQKVLRESIAETLAILISHPFQVLAVRSMAQFISREDAYESLIGGILEIKDSQEGVAGFFKGAVPRIVGALIAISLTETLTYTLQKYIESADDDVKEHNKDLFQMMSKHCALFASVIVGSFTYPYQLVSTIMTLSGSRLRCATTQTSWSQMLASLKKSKQHQRGSSIFLGRKMPALDIAVAAAFALQRFSDVTVRF